MQSENTKFSVLHAIHKMAKMNDVIQDTHGNVSERVGDTIEFYIKPSGVEYNLVGIDDVCSSLHGSKSGKKPSVDTSHHAAIYKNYPWIGAICHTHSPYAVAYAAYGVNLRCYITEHADYFGGDIFCLPYADLNSWGSKVSISKTTKACLLEKHGVLTFGKNAEEAVKLAAALENVARKNYLIENGFGTDKVLPAFEVDKWHRRYTNDYGQKDGLDSE